MEIKRLDMKINEYVYSFEKIKGANSYLCISDSSDISIIHTGITGNAVKILSQIAELDISLEKLNI